MITAKIIADSVNKAGNRLTTWELVYPRLIHSELMTHKMFSKNAASSRAIPVKTVNQMIRDNPAYPSRFGANQSGMQDKGGEHTAPVRIAGSSSMTAMEAWHFAAEVATEISDAFAEAEYHKQVCNRITEPFQWMKTVLTGTEHANFFWLRNHKDADPTLAELAKKMEELYRTNEPILLLPDQWHLPYYKDGYWIESQDGLDIHGTTLDDAIAISLSCCAQVSYRKLDDTIDKAKSVVSRLNLDSETEPKHSSPAEHQGTPMLDTPAFIDGVWERGVTSFHRDLGKMSGNLAGWVQYRQLIPDHTKW